MNWQQYYNPKSPGNSIEGYKLQETARVAYNRVASTITSLPSSASNNVRPLDLQTSIEDALREVLKAQDVYQKRRSRGKAQEYLSALSSRIHYYSPVMDALAQHHPEYVALAWGTIKLLLTALLNHEERIITLAKVLSRIAEQLPRFRLMKELYPIPQIDRGIQFLYARIMDFLTHALGWLREGKLKHMFHAVTHPVSVQYKELFDEISECSTQVQQWAEAAAQTELRDVHIMQSDILRTAKKQYDVSKHNTIQLDDIRSLICTIASQTQQIDCRNTIQSAALINQSTVVDKVQISQMLERAAGHALTDPQSALRQALFLCNRRKALDSTLHNTMLFWQSAKLLAWISVPFSSILRVTSSFTSRSQAQELGIGLIRALRYKQRPVLWVLPNGTAEVDSIFHTLLLQALQINTAFQSSSACARIFRRLVDAANQAEWVDVLTEVLSKMLVVYIVIDLRAVAAHVHIQPWLPQLEQLFIKLGSRTSVKVFFMMYSRADYLTLPDTFAGIASDAAMHINARSLSTTTIARAQRPSISASQSRLGCKRNLIHGSTRIARHLRDPSAI